MTPSSDMDISHVNRTNENYVKHQEYPSSLDKMNKMSANLKEKKTRHRMSLDTENTENLQHHTFLNND